MRVLVDTHVFLWWINADRRISAKAKEILSNGESSLLFSAASLWEVAIKLRTGKLRLAEPAAETLREQMAAQRMTDLPVRADHALALLDLPLLHRDPFDQILIAQARTEKLPILSADPLISQYPVEVIW